MISYDTHPENNEVVPYMKAVSVKKDIIILLIIGICIFLSENRVIIIGRSVSMTLGK